MQTPREFEQLAQFFLPDYGQKWTTGREMIDAAIAHVSPGSRTVCKKFLAEILNNGLADAQLVKIWDSTSPIYWFKETSIRKFLTELHSAL